MKGICMRDCSACGKRKDESEFGVNRALPDGLMGKCKECVSAYRKAYREKQNADKPSDWKKKTEDMAEYQRAWKEANPGYMTRKKKEWWEKHRDRLRVKERVKYAVRVGKLVKGPCEVCGEALVEAHHPNYDRPLDVVWLCKKHHREIHA